MQICADRTAVDKQVSPVARSFHDRELIKPHGGEYCSVVEVSLRGEVSSVYIMTCVPEAESWNDSPTGRRATAIPGSVADAERSVS